MSLASLINSSVAFTLDPAFNPNVGTFAWVKAADNSTGTVTGEFSLNRLRGDLQMDRDGNRQEFEATLRVAAATVLRPNDRITRNDVVWFVEGPVYDDGRQVVYSLTSTRRETITRVPGSMQPAVPRRR